MSNTRLTSPDADAYKAVLAHIAAFYEWHRLGVMPFIREQGSLNPMLEPGIAS